MTDQAGAVTEARKLEAEALRVGEDGSQGRKLRAQAAELRRQALGTRVYPVLVCAECYRITGWTAADGRCDSCVRRGALQAAYSNPSGGWVTVPNVQPIVQEPPKVPLTERLALLRRGQVRVNSPASEWLRLVMPGESGPIDPEQNYDVEVAHRQEFERVDGNGVLVRFTTATHRFVDGTWQRLESTHVGSRELLVPAEFPADLLVGQIVEAWTDYQADVHAFNQRSWAAISAARENAQEAQETRVAAFREQSRVSELLQEEA